MERSKLTVKVTPASTRGTRVNLNSSDALAGVGVGDPDLLATVGTTVLVVEVVVHGDDAEGMWSVDVTLWKAGYSLVGVLRPPTTVAQANLEPGSLTRVGLALLELDLDGCGKSEGEDSDSSDEFAEHCDDCDCVL